MIPLTRPPVGDGIPGSTPAIACPHTQYNFVRCAGALDDREAMLCCLIVDFRVTLLLFFVNCTIVQWHCNWSHGLGIPVE